MKVRHLHKFPAIWKGNEQYHAWKKRQRSIRRQREHRRKLFEEAFYLYARPA